MDMPITLTGWDLNKYYDMGPIKWKVTYGKDFVVRKVYQIEVDEEIERYNWEWDVREVREGGVRRLLNQLVREHGLKMETITRNEILSKGKKKGYSSSLGKLSGRKGRS